MILVYTACASKKEAEKISNKLLSRRLCACTNTFPIESRYWWKGKKVKIKEVGLIIKTTNKKFKTIEGEIKSLHSYAAPCIIKIRVNEAEKSYHAWLNKEIR